MGPRVALAATLPESALDLVASCCEVQAHYPFTTSRWELHRALDTETQGLIHDFARTAPEVRWHARAQEFRHQHLREALADFGAWCRDGCPVTIDGANLPHTRGFAGDFIPGMNFWCRLKTNSRAQRAPLFST